MYLGIEIGGTKLQLGVGPGNGELTALERRDIMASEGAAGILAQIRTAGRDLISRFPIEHIGFGFGGPVLASQGMVQKSHQVQGWDHFPLCAWAQTELGRPASIGNDCDVAALAEAYYGAAQDVASLLYVTVGTGIGGGLVFDRKIFGTQRPAAAEIGHLRPGLAARDSHQTVESLAAGPGISAEVARQLRLGTNPHDPAVSDLLARCGQDLNQLTTRIIAEAAASGNTLCVAAYHSAADVLGWAIAQTITLVAPERVVVGGGVSLAGEELFFRPLRAATQRYVFGPLANSFTIVPAGLGETVVVHGALALAAAAARTTTAGSTLV